MEIKSVQVFQQKGNCIQVNSPPQAWRRKKIFSWTTQKEWQELQAWKPPSDLHSHQQSGWLEAQDPVKLPCVTRCQMLLTDPSKMRIDSKCNDVIWSLWPVQYAKNVAFFPLVRRIISSSLSFLSSLEFAMFYPNIKPCTAQNCRLPRKLFLCDNEPWHSPCWGRKRSVLKTRP